MQLISKWLQKKYRQQEKFVSLQDALLDKSIDPYIFFRLRFFSLNLLIILAVHLIEFFLIARIFTQAYFIDLLLLRSFSLLISGGWWGGLEILRTRVRYFRQEGRRDLIKQEIGNWLMLSAVLSWIVLLVAMSFSIYDVFPYGGIQIDLFNIYRVVILIQIACQLTTKTFHAGIYGLRRVARPFISISAADLVAVLSSLVFWPIFGPISLPMALLISALVSTFLTTYYTRRAYRLLHLLPITVPAWNSFKQFLKQLPSAELFFATVAAMAMVVDGFMIAILLKSNSAGPITILHFGFLLYLIVPLIRGSYEWPTLFYFDLKLLQRKLLAVFRRRFEGQLLNRAGLISSPFWLLAVAIAISYAGPSVWLFCVLLLPFFILNSMFGFLQLKAFTNLRYWDVIISGLGLLITSVFIVHYKLTLTGQLSLIICYLFLAYLYLKSPLLPKVRSVPFPRGNLGMTPWLFELLKIREPIQIHVITIDMYESVHTAQILVNRIAEKLGKNAGIAIIDNRFILCYQLQRKDSGAISQRLLVDIGCGLIYQYKFTPICANGRQAFDIAVQRDLFVGLLPSNASFSQHAGAKNNLFNLYQHRFPNAIIYTAEGESYGAIKMIDRETRRFVFTQAQLFIVAPQQQSKDFPWHTSAIYENGSMTAVFVIPKNTYSANLISVWMGEVNHYNLCNTLSKNREA